MTDREKAIKGLECLANENAGCYTDCPYYADNRCFSKTAADALALLREQEPVKPEPREIWVGSNGAFVLEWHCGACGCGVMKNDRWQTKFCPECGKAVKWDE